MKGETEETVNAEDCPHLSWSGDEGPLAELGRWPRRWRCDGCGKVEERADA